MVRIFGFLLCLVTSLPVSAGIADISNADAASGLRQALTDGSAAAVKMLGAENGYFGNAKVRIPLPPSLQRVEGAMRMMGMKKQADELVLSMNRAAEAAAPEARQLLVDAVKKMSVQDAKLGLVKGEDASIETYVTRKALDGLYLMIAEQEKSFRQNPVGATSNIVRKVFGALK